VQLWFLSKNVLTAAECGAALSLALEDRKTQPGSWGGCRAEYISTSDIKRAMKWWDEEHFRNQLRNIIRPGYSQNTNAQPNNVQQVGSAGDDRELVQPDNLEQLGFGGDDSKLDMDWEPSAEENEYPGSPSSSEEESEPRQVVRKQQAIRVPTLQEIFGHSDTKNLFTTCSLNSRPWSLTKTPWSLNNRYSAATHTE
jgi:hypothetical protein